MPELPAVHVLTLSSGLSLPLQDALLTRAEAVLHQHGAARVWVDPTAPGTCVLAEFPTLPGPPGAGADPEAAVPERSGARCLR